MVIFHGYSTCSDKPRFDSKFRIFSHWVSILFIFLVLSSRPRYIHQITIQSHQIPLKKKHRFQTAWNHPLRVTISKASGIVVVLLGVQLGLLNAARWQQPGTVADAQRTVAPLWVTVGMIMGLQLVEWEN